MSVLLSSQRHAAFRNSSSQNLQQTILKLRRCPYSIAASSQLCLLSRKSLSSIETCALPRARSLLPSSLYLLCSAQASLSEGGSPNPFTPFGDVLARRSNQDRR